jgi:hypothetical protein
MATQDMILKLSFDDEGTFVGLEDINQELQKVNDSTAQVEKSTKTLKQQYAELKKQQDQFDPGTKKFQELSVQMGELKDRMNDAADAVKGNTGPAIEGARASFGLMGEQIANLDFEGLSQSLNLVSGNLARLKPEDISKGLKSMAEAGVNAFKAIGKAILANPLLAISAVIVGIAMNFDKIIKFFPEFENALTGIDEKQRAVAKNAQAQFDASKKAYDYSLLQENAMRLQGKSEKEILQFKMAGLESKIKEGKISLQIQEQQAQGQIDASKRNAELLTQIVRGALELSAVGLRMLSAPIDLVLATANKVSEALGFGKITAVNLNDEITKLTEAGSKMVSELLIDPVAQEKELKESLDKQRYEIAQMESDYKGFQLNIKKIDEDASKDKKDKLEKDQAEFEKSQEEITAILAKWEEERLAMEAELAAYQKTAREDRLNDEERIAEEIYQASLSAQQKEIEAVRNKYFELITLAEFYGEDSTSLKEAQAKAEAEIVKKYADEEIKIEDEKNKKKQEMRMANIQSNFEMASLALDTLSSLNEASAKGDEASQRKVFERNKNIQKAQATIAMASGIVQQLAVPQDQLTGMNFVKAAALAAAGIANIVKINQTQFNGSVPSPNGGNLTAPSGMGNAPAIDFSGANMMNNAPGSVETYVLAGNVANALEARQKIIDQSYL